MIWDDDKNKFIYEIGLPRSVLSVRMTKDKLALLVLYVVTTPLRLFVILYTDIHIFSFPVVKTLKNITTPPNPLGMCVN